MVGVLLDRFKKYLLMLKLICFGSMTMLLIGYGVFSSYNLYAVAFNSMMIGALIVPILPVGCAFAGELTFPM
jgi:hypothetical protein